MKKLFKRDFELNEEVGEIDALRQSVLDARLPEPVERIALKEVDRLFKISPSSAEYTIAINYVDYLLSLPWHRVTEDNLDIHRAETILNREHYGLDEIKERILEYLSVRLMKLTRKKTILVVDDEKTTRMNLMHVLSKEGYVVKTGANGQEALRLIDANPYDLVITDLKMAGGDGLSVLDQVKKKHPRTQVIIITGYATVSTAVDAMKKGSYHFLAKPLRLDELRSTVANALSAKIGVVSLKSPVICFVGPPGTGKTSLGLAIADSLQRKFIRISLAGMRDEAEIRGHRRSYVGAQSGRIIQEIRRAESSNPVFMLDEIDKIGQDFKGDPAAALLEVLDPQQNVNFIDHYLDVPFDLSKTLFIATANTVGRIPRPLLDRFEVIPLSGYTVEDKENIAAKYLIPRAIEEAGLTDTPPSFSASVVNKIIREYTREAGLRDLERKIAAICRKITRQLLSQNPKQAQQIEITPELVEELLGPRRYHFEVAGAKDRVGCSTGLAWTETGGEIIFIETTKMMGSNNLILTGSLGEVMKESAQAALSYIRSNTDLFHLAPDFFHKQDIHIHVPAGAIPKDGPSAGLAIAMALLSLLTGRPCKRDTAMTGELTLSGRILPVGGLKEKLIAARTAGIQTVIFPMKNSAELTTIDDDLKKDLNLVTAGELHEVLDIVLR